jgi:hypothetical protein
LLNKNEIFISKAEITELTARKPDPGKGARIAKVKEADH